MTLKQLAEATEQHPYYCHDSNFYSREAYQEWDTWADFYEEYKDADIDMNLIFRFDLKQHEGQESYYLKVYFIRQRKGIFMPELINIVEEKDAQTVSELLQQHFETMQKLWLPFSSVTTPAGNEG